MAVDMEMTGYYYVFGLGWACLFSSFICSWIVVSLVYAKFKKDGTLAISHRFPLYIAVTDIGFSMAVFLNQIHPVLYRKTWDDFPCKLFSVSIAFTGLTNMTIVTSIAVLTYLRVCRNKDIDTGVFDWKIHLCTWGMGVTWGLVGVPSFGPSKYWCYQESFSSNKSAGLIVIGINVILFCTTALCFFAVLMRMQKYKTKFSQKKVVTIRDSKAMDSGFAPKDTIATKTKANANDLQSTISQGFKGMAANQPTLKDQYNTVENRAVRKMLLHIVSFFIQWSSTIPYCLGTVFDYYEDWIYVMCNVGMNLGGIMNLTAYLINQRK